MKSLLTILIILIVLFMACVASGDGVTLWGLSEVSAGDETALSARVGYEVGKIEAFAGTTWRPDYDAPQVLSLGAVHYFADIIDPNSVVPFIPDVLMTFMHPGSVAQPYIGGQATFNLLDKDAGFMGIITGLQIKADEDSRAAIVAEVMVNDYFGDLGGVNDEWRLSLGVRYGF